ncbi:MAG: 16S rRNA (guanine(527)-N(7))-methyltransferase RsmG [Dehalococcoidia bacterium]|nr:MAG: 16S rRNA (guanine(527)-N(7))-methyltransferase RsmG [Dehalococcoidia bacterium]
MKILATGTAKLGLKLNDEQLSRFETFYRELIDWNKKFNLTAITEYDEVQTKHFLDSLSVALALPEVPLPQGYRVIDIGTGAGLPGIPLKIAFPQIKLALLEATRKKAGFLEHVKSVLGLNDVEVVALRAEEAAHLPAYREKFDLALVRAVAALPALVEIALPFLRAGGRLIAQKKGDIEDEVASSKTAIKKLGGKLAEVKLIEIPELADNRFLVVIDKVAPSPGIYPRRAGLPTKQPIK